MSAVKKILPAQPRGEDRRSQPRTDQQDWRVNQRSYEFIGATFDPLTPMQTLARAKWMTRNHGFRYICLLYTSPSPRDKRQSRMPSSA